MIIGIIYAPIVHASEAKHVFDRELESSADILLASNKLTMRKRIRTQDKRAPDVGKIWLFTTPLCGYCEKAKAFLTVRKIRFKEIDISMSWFNDHLFQSLGGIGVPLTVIGWKEPGRSKSDIKIHGFTDEKFSQVFQKKD